MESTHRAEEHPFNVHVLHLYLIYIKYVSLIFGKNKCLHLVHVGYLNLVHRGAFIFNPFVSFIYLAHGPELLMHVDHSYLDTVGLSIWDSPVT